MTFDITGLVDFSPENNAWKLSLVTTYRPLINETKLLKQLLPENSGDQAFKKLRRQYRDGLQPGTFRFDSYTFRQQYLAWIYAHFSSSLANHRMVRQDEQAFLLEWAKRFNQVHHHLKIVRAAPQGNETRLIVRLLMIGLRFHHQQGSFNLKQAFAAEYDRDWPTAFYYFEADEGRRMARIMQTELNQDIPDGRFQLVNVPLAADQLTPLSPDFDSQAASPAPVQVYHQPVESASSVSAPNSVTPAKFRSERSSRSQLSSGDSQSSSRTSQSLKNTSLIASLISGWSSAARANSEFSMELKSCQKTKGQLSSRFKSLSARAKVSSEKLQSIHSLAPSVVRFQSLSDPASNSSAAKSASLRSKLSVPSKSASSRYQSYRSKILSSCHNYYRSLTDSVLASDRKSWSSWARSLKLKEKRSQLSDSLGAVYGISSASNSASASDDHYQQEIADNFSGSFDRRNFDDAFNGWDSHHLNYVPVVIIISVVIIIVLIFVLPFLKL